ncbi:MAG: bifunctional 4-hydroxy-3-methylbut-2-enyl diphosphate reductase/30S ribosomal protein S1 [Eubacteriales bacterium]|nr:bifunctional 4-hydroxy-3-methylbut-2-enyl diphosphate reductase/30S ribosomal protein S1 [Eubacteriales bacterium]
MITVAESGGFCFGVKRATDCVEKLLSEHSNTRIYTLGKLIHNSVYIKELEERGVFSVSEEEIEEIAEKSSEESPVVLVIRAHGITAECEKNLSRLSQKHKFFTYTDMTCPFVKRIHKIAVENTDDETVFLLLGDEKHPEVLGIMSYAKGVKKALIDSNSMEKYLLDTGFPADARIVLASQTTQSTDEWKKCQKNIKKLYTNTKIFDTICNVTEKRQKEAVELSSSSDVMIVIGGKDSSNTAKLFDICKKNCPATYRVESISDLDGIIVDSSLKIGITAGASTPANIITEVQRRMNTENFDFAAMLEESLKTIHTGDIVTGIITDVTPSKVYLDLGTKVTGEISRDQITDDVNADLKAMFKPGDEVEAFVIRVNDAEGVATLSKKRVDNDKAWLEIVALKESGNAVDGKIVSAVKGGLLVDINGFKAFMPASQVSLNRIEDLNTVVGETKKVVVIDVDKAKKRAVCSAKTLEKEAKKILEDKVWETLEVGQHYKGVVKNFIPHGAFVDIGGVDGFIPNIELSYKRIKHPSQIVKLGQEVEVYIKELDRENRKITLGYKTEEMDPFFIFKNTYKVGDDVDAKIVSIMPFGAFAEVIDGADGLIHISKICREKINKPEDVLSIGQIVRARITDIDVDNRKFNLSMRVYADEEYNAQKAEERAKAKAEREAQRKAEAEEKAKIEAEMAPYIVRTIE